MTALDEDGLPVPPPLPGERIRLGAMIELPAQRLGEEAVTLAVSRAVRRLYGEMAERDLVPASELLIRLSLDCAARR